MSNATVLTFPEMRRGIYISSKVKHAARWIALRDSGIPIVSTWIDAAVAGQSKDLADCIAEASACGTLIAYRADGEIFKKGWLEIGAALACRVPVLAIGFSEFPISEYRGMTHFSDFDSALLSATTDASTKGDGK